MKINVICTVDIEITVPVGDIPMTGNGAHIAAESADPQNTFETVHGMPVYYGGDLNDYDTWEDWCDSHIRDRYCGFPPEDEDAQLPVIICAPVFLGKHIDEPL